ncbi:hypothetical protein AWC38_SpisGene21541 [Stylophora pistillata]|uniref:Uncharacterized protein n=1 Tax=Stylophora pistillata TaxID=50429 RepID=A0A2B4RD99_STYPI|nr:hypothetical protein AWC38_SpisGene21541 [Stylophora pistillata]
MEKNTVVQLRRIAKESGLHGYANLRKDELIKRIKLIQSRANSSTASSSSTSTSSTAPATGKVNAFTQLREMVKKNGDYSNYSKRLRKLVRSRASTASTSTASSTGKKKDLEEISGRSRIDLEEPLTIAQFREKARKQGLRGSDYRKRLREFIQSRENSNSSTSTFNKKGATKRARGGRPPSSSLPRFKLVERMSSLKQFAKMYTIDGVMGYGPKDFLKAVKPTVINFLNTKKNNKMELFLKCYMIKEHIDTGEVEGQDAYFTSFQKIVFQETDREEIYDECVGKMLESLATFTRKGSGWTVHSVEGLDLHTVKYTPLKGSSYIELPKHLARKMAIINMKNKDEECFKWCVTRALCPVRSHPERITKILRKQAEKLVWDEIEFPMEVRSIRRFEKLNPGIGVNVYMYEDGLNPLRVSSEGLSTTKVVIDLLLIAEGDKKHYCLIKNLSRLVSSQLSKKKNKKFICRRCLNYFGSERLLNTHDVLCRFHEAVREKMPDADTFLSFKNHHKRMDMPFVIYADFESIIKLLLSAQPNPKECYTERKQQHIPVSFCYFVKCWFDDRYSKVVEYTAKSANEDVAQKFVESLEAEVKSIYEDHPSKKMIFTDSDVVKFENATCCWLCGEDFQEGEEKVRDHCHYTGEFRGAAHNSCNLKFQRPKFTPIVLHNLANYDAHLFVRNLGVSEGEIDCIPNNEEKYISFTKHIVVDKFFDTEKEKDVEVKRELRFIDSFKFMASSLDKLVKNLAKKGESFFQNTGKYYSGEKLKLLMRKGVYPYEWMDSIHKLDEPQLPPKEAFFSVLSGRGISDKDYTHAQNVWKVFGCKTFRDYHNLYNRSDVLLLADVFENFRELCKENYDLDPCWYFTAPGLAWDACLKLTKIELELLSDINMLHMFEAGIRGGISMISTRHAKANNKYMGERFDPTQPSKFITYLDANNLYGWAMSKCLPTGGFEWVDEKDFRKWKNFPCILEVDLKGAKEELHDHFNDYPPAPENLLIGKVHKLVCTLNEKKKYIVHHEALKQYMSLGIEIGKIHRVTSAIHMGKTQILFNKPLYLGMSILDLSKTLMYDFHYNYIKPKYGDRSKLLFTDTDSLCYEIQTEDFYKDIIDDLDRLFDTSNISKEHLSGIPTGVNKKVIGKFKDEAGGKIIEEFVGLRAKLYSYKMFEDGDEKKKCKGMKTGVVDRTISFDDYKRCLFSGVKQLRKMNTLRSRKHEMYMEEINKVALSANDDKRIILPDKIHTYAIGHRLSNQ